MANLTVNRIQPAHIAPHGVDWGGSGAGREYRQPRRRRASSLGIVATLLPGADPADYEVHYEMEDGQMVGIIVRELATGRIAAVLGHADLEGHAAAPGSIIERRG